MKDITPHGPTVVGDVVITNNRIERYMHVLYVGEYPNIGRIIRIRIIIIRNTIVYFFVINKILFEILIYIPFLGLIKGILKINVILYLRIGYITEMRHKHIAIIDTSL